MIKYLAMSFVLLMSGALMACNETTGQSAQPKIASVDVARVMRDSVPGKEGVKFIENQQKELQAKLDELQAKLEKNPEDQTSMQELQRVYAQAQQSMQTEGQNVANLIYDVVQRTLDEYRVKNGYQIILGIEAIASFDPKMDITSAVLAEVDKKKIDFKPVAQPAAAAPAESSVQAASDPAAETAKDEAKAPEKADVAPAKEAGSEAPAKGEPVSEKAAQPK